MNFNVNDIVVDFVATFGKNYALVDVVAKPVYKDGVKTDEVIFNYDIVCLDKKMKHLNVKIPGKQLISVPENEEFISVALTGVVAKPYVINNQLNFTVTATDIKEVKM